MSDWVRHYRGPKEFSIPSQTCSLFDPAGGLSPFGQVHLLTGLNLCQREVGESRWGLKMDMSLVLVGLR